MIAINSSLNNLIYIYSVDTSAFYNDKEHEINKKLMMTKRYKSTLSQIIKPLNKFMTNSNKLLKKDEVEQELTSLEDKLIDYVNKNKVFFNQIDEYLYFDKKNRTYKINKKSTLHKLEQKLNEDIRHYNSRLDDEAENHKGVRILRKDALKEENKISLFESTLTRSMGINEDELSTEIIVVRAYRYSILDDIIQSGFRLSGENYEYFASSAGQIRNKKSCFVRTRKLNSNNHEIRNKLMCGLSVGKINRRGGINQNKFQAYISLTNSSSVPWTNFDINKCIVVDDMELKVSGLVDYIDHKTYKIKRTKKDIPIEFMDGAGIMLPSVSERSFQFRMPFFKGLLIPFDFREFIFDYELADFTVKDIYGKEHHIFKDDVRIIFTKSQFKLWSYYNNWDEYKGYFERFDCEAAICKIEESDFDDKPINYQMIQSLNFSKTELKSLASKTIEDIKLIGEDQDTMLRLLGADESNERKNYFQKALSVYPQLLNDEYSKQVIKDRRQSLIKQAKSGRILLEGTKRSYISPDLYAFAEWLFAGIEKPNGLLKNGEVSCRLFGDEKLDVLRSPHLFREHCVRRNIRNKDTDKWFISNCIYTSVHDMISKQLMFDVDGDDALIINNELFVDRAERQMIRTVPLDYTLSNAKKSKVTNENIVESLKAAYSKNIGEISNLMTKIWNSSNHLKKEEMELIKILCMENNAIIDFAKTLWMPTRSGKIEKKIKKYNKMKVPYFFQFAKNKDKSNTEKVNESTVNKLTEVIPNNRINFVKVAGKFDYKDLMKNKRHKNDSDLSGKVIAKYTELDQNKSLEVKKQVKENDKVDMRTELSVYKGIRKELLAVVDDSNYLSDVLVKYLYNEKNSKFKDTLWRCFGKEIYRNIEYNVLDIKRCIKCEIEIEKSNSKKYCGTCSKEKERESNRIRQLKFKNRIKITETNTL